MAGSNDLSGFGHPVQQNDSVDHEPDQHAMEDFFEQNLDKLRASREEAKVSSQQNNYTGKQHIDLLEGNDEEQEDLNINNDDDDEVKEVKKNAQQNNFVNIFGLEGEHNGAMSNLRKSRARGTSSGGVRSSIAGKFFMRKDTESQRSEIATPALNSDKQPKPQAHSEPKQPNPAPAREVIEPKEPKQPDATPSPALSKQSNNFVSKPITKEEERKEQPPQVQTPV